jgi:hypothetical protein
MEESSSHLIVAHEIDYTMPYLTISNWCCSIWKERKFDNDVWYSFYVSTRSTDETMDEVFVSDYIAYIQYFSLFQQF